MKNSKTVGLKSKKKTINIKNKSNKKVVKPKKKIQIKTIKPKKVSKKVVESKKLTTSDVTVTSDIVTGPKKRKKKIGEKMYFTTDTEKAIIQYNKEQSMDIRNEIYDEQIKPCFDKLVENVFNTFKFTYFDNSPIEIQKETIAHLVANMHKFEEGKGKAFSYFSIVAKNYLIFHNNNNYKRFNQHVDISETPSDSTVCLQTTDSYHDELETSEFMKLMVDYWEKNIGKIFTKQRDLNIANAVIELFRNSDRIDSFNKKALYLYIREISSCKTQQITKVINKMKQYQNTITKSYLDRGTLKQEMYAR
jgi:hypothetical protein